MSDLFLTYTSSKTLAKKKKIPAVVLPLRLYRFSNQMMSMYSASRLARRFCATLASAPAAIVGEASAATASTRKTAKKHRSVYKKLSNIGSKGGKMEETLNKLAMEGIPIVKHDLVRYAKDLRKNRLPQRALEVGKLCLLI